MAVGQFGDIYESAFKKENNMTENTKIELNKVTEYADFQSPGTIRFGNGSIQTLQDEIINLGVREVFIISDRGVVLAGLVDKLFHVLNPLGVKVETFNEISGEPTFQDVQNALDNVNDSNADIVIGIGGGS